jgi:hypothetical protein
VLLLLLGVELQQMTVMGWLLLVHQGQIVELITIINRIWRDTRGNTRGYVKASTSSSNPDV